MEIKIKRLTESAKMPFKKHEFDAGFDLYVDSVEVDEDKGLVTYGTGLAFEIPEGHVGLLFPRSSVSKADMLLSNSVGVLDAPYRGEVTVKFWRLSEENQYEIGDRAIQLVIIPIPEVSFVEVSELTETVRGKGGFGSTGKK